MPEWREMTEQIDWRAKQLSQVAGFSEDLKCWGAWNTTSGHNAKDITRSITWRREAWKEEALGDLPWKDERGPSSLRWTLELFQRQRWKLLSERRGGAHMGISDCIDSILNWTVVLLQSVSCMSVIITNNLPCRLVSAGLAEISSDLLRTSRMPSPWRGL